MVLIVDGEGLSVKKRIRQEIEEKLVEDLHLSTLLGNCNHF